MSASEANKEQKGKQFEILQALRLEEFKRMNSFTVSTEVSRDNIYNDLINCFKKRSNLSHLFMVTFEGEHEAGDGVCRDAFSAFYQKIYSKFDGEFC